jgi:sulfur relay (sulfurtransferase) complex TusBCD TusD component (DsrE family)
MSAIFLDKDDGMARKLGILILSEPKAGDLQTVLGLCQAAQKMGVEVEVFLMGDAVYHLGNSELGAFAQQGVKISFCALNAMERSLHERPHYPWGIEEGTQYHLASILEGSDRFLAFT